MQLVCASCPCVPLNLFSKMTLILKRSPFIMQKDVIHSPSALLSLCPFPDLVPEVHFLSGCHFSSSCFPSLCYGINYFFLSQLNVNTRRDRIVVMLRANEAYLVTISLFSLVLTRIFSLDTTHFSVVDVVRSCMMGPMMQVAREDRILPGVQHDRSVR